MGMGPDLSEKAPWLRASPYLASWRLKNALTLFAAPIWKKQFT